MRLAIIGAMEKEVAILKDKLNNLEIINVHHLTFYKGNYKHHEIILTISGVGKVSSGIIVSTIINTFNKVDKIINVGVSGGVMGKIEPGNIVIGKYYSYADVYVALPGYSFGKMPGCPQFFNGDQEILDILHDECYIGTILTGDKFFVSKEETDKIINNYFSDKNVLAFDMESSALAQASFVYDIPFMAIRAISDIIGSENQSDNYKNYVLEACKKATIALESILGALK